MTEQRGDETAAQDAGRAAGRTEDQPAGEAPPAAGDTPAGESEGQPAGPRQVTVRRAPRYRAFVLTGAALGALTGLVLTVGAPGGDYSARSLLGYLAVSLALLGGLLGGLVAVLVERPKGR